MSIADSSNSLLMVIDIQDKLVSAIPKVIRNRIVEHVEILLTAVDVLSIPVIATQQYSKGLGPLVAPILNKLPTGSPVIEKTCFSSVRVEAVTTALEQSDCKQIFLVGMETHICILQTALDLLKQGYEVFVIEDAVGSRAESNQFNALRRMRLAGACITNLESVLFEWLGDASHPEFKKLAKLII